MSEREYGRIMTGKELIKWIEENKAEEYVLIAVSPRNEYQAVTGIWEGESGGGAIMLNTAEE